MCLVNLRQGQVEKTMNIGMTAQTILAKFPKINHSQVPPGSLGVTETLINKNTYSKFFKSVFDLVYFYFYLKLNFFVFLIYLINFQKARIRTCL